MILATIGLGAGESVASGTSKVLPLGHRDGLASLAPARHSAATADGQVAVTVHNTRGIARAVSASDFAVSSEGDVFGARAWDGGTRTTVGPGESHVFRLSFSMPSAAWERAVLFYRLGRREAPVTLALEALPTSPEGSASTSPGQLSTGALAPSKAFAPANAFTSALTSTSTRTDTFAAKASFAAMASASQPTINSFPANGGVGEPWGTAVDSAGNVWFAEPGCDFAPTCSASTAPGQIGELKAATHTFAFFTLPNITGNQPIFLAFDGSGNLWFTTPDNSMIGEFSPASGQFIGQWPVTAGSGPWDLTFAGGKIYYTEHLVSAVGSFDPSTHAFHDFATPSANTNPYGIATSGSLVWFTENNSNVDRIASLNTATNAISEYPIALPLSNSTPHLVAIGANGNPWWSEGWSNTIATLNPSAATPGQ